MRSTTRGARKVLQDYLREHDLLPKPGQSQGTTGLLDRLKGSAHEAMVRALVRQVDGLRRDRFEAALQAVLEHHKDPTAREIHAQLSAAGHRAYGLSGDDVLGGDESRWRREYLLARGWVEQRGTWKPPGHQALGKHKWPPHASLGNGAQRGDEQECELCGRVRWVNDGLRYRYARSRQELEEAPGGWGGRLRAGGCAGRRT